MRWSARWEQGGLFCVAERRKVVRVGYRSGEVSEACCLDLSFQDGDAMNEEARNFKEAAEAKVRAIVAKITDLEEELAQALHEQEGEILYRLEGSKVRFEEAIRVAHRQFKVNAFRWFSQSPPLNVISAPVIYSFIVPLVLIDLWITAYQVLCFPFYKIPKVERAKYIVLDRHHLAYLNSIERLNCIYCGYANGLLAYAREVASKTEQYWCPVKHASRILNPHYRYARFRDYSNAEEFHDDLERYRSALAKEED